ncbi:Site-specific DNA-adenine methylase [Pseudarcicella hirudinis]|uniref:Site-specific DNA-adenine methylase n=1 Tax=Pseudarcicella hirudinis TaxID=1079859 RepID=A0A1I5RUN9_9BACT|nr:hypothetical protein [Pseudarcicella hirudinis]SFP62242.1 Site-specific DNA-adenine methylase [Pseudarcicella hirudinis]
MESYFGGKGSDGTYQTIINQIPAVDIYVESYAGHASIFRNMIPAHLTILNDINHRVYQNLVNHFPESIRFAHDTDRKDFIRIYHENNRACSIGEIKCTCQGNNDAGSILIIENLGAIDLIEKYKALIEDFNSLIYSDPPYPLGSRKSQVKRYEFEMTDQDHIEYLECLKNIRCKQLISTYPNQIYQELLPPPCYSLIEFWSQTRGGLAKEYLYKNYESPVELQDYRYLGSDFRERDKLKRIKRNFLRKFKEMPVQLQNSILKELR